MINFFNELWQLIKMLFKSKPNDFKEVELMSMHCFPFKGYKYMMWCGRMIYRSDNADRILSSLGSSTFKKEKTHETIHLKQAQQKKTWIKYYLKYVCEWFKGNPFFPPFISAYYTIPFEMEAYSNEDNSEYVENYDGKYLHCYDIKKRKKTFKKCGSTYQWKKYIKKKEKTA